MFLLLYVYLSYGDWQNVATIAVANSTQTYTLTDDPITEYKYRIRFGNPSSEMILIKKFIFRRKRKTI
jgi:hypothetical protein